MKTMDDFRVPQHMQDGIAAYIKDGVPQGGFLTAVLTNNLKGACGAADEINRHHIWDIVNYLYNCAPYPCWGSQEKHDAWIAQHREARRIANEQRGNSATGISGAANPPGVTGGQIASEEEPKKIG
jgi:hypothetical protein